ncbi:hypothetical protein, partial [Salmonella enterica]|uniref:hypothetical protein n=1 Tax=Salmonella enterica TaxID=28901 RepID=UPI0019D5D33D
MLKRVQHDEEAPNGRYATSITIPPLPMLEFPCFTEAVTRRVASEAGQAARTPMHTCEFAKRFNESFNQPVERRGAG